MVSKKGVKVKFYDGERVLCYEPDPTKAKVLYDSKVLRVIISKDQRGRKSVAYLIHFQGWNSSWDRNVGEEYVLKDTPENRQLQRDLAEKAQLQLGAYLYRRERKKRNHKLSDRVTQSSEDGSSSSPALMDVEDSHVSSSSESSSSAEEESVLLELTDALKHCLEHDHYLITTKNKLLKLPAEPHAVAVLEMYYRQYTSIRLRGVREKPNTRSRNSAQIKDSPIKLNEDQVYKDIKLCREVVDGLRVYFDFTLTDLLLYNQEQGQTTVAPSSDIVVSCPTKTENCASVTIKTENEDSSDYVQYTNNLENESQGDESDVDSLGQKSGDTHPRRWLRSHRSSENSDCNGLSSNAFSEVSNIKQEILPRKEMPEQLSKLLAWRLLPAHAYNQYPPPPSLVYGAVHLTRLLVKLPELLYASNMSEDKLKALIRHLDHFIDFLNNHRDWFGDKHYVDATNQT